MESSLPSRTCRVCGTASPSPAAFCSLCGQALSTTTTALRPDQPKPRWYHNVWFVLLMISPFALGPFGLSLLWKSSQFSPRAKAGLTMFTIAWTLLAVWYVAAVMVPAVMKEVNQFNSTLSF